MHSWGVAINELHDIAVTPTVSDGLFFLRENFLSTAEMGVFNDLGQEVKKKNISGSGNILNLIGFDPEYYLNENRIYKKKVFVK